MVLVAGGAAPAGAQIADGPDAAFRATRGVFVPNGARAGMADATAVELNAAQLGFLDDAALALVGNAWRADAAMPGRGAALFAASALGKAGGLGLGLQGIGASGVDALPGHGKFQLAYGVGGRRLALGATWGHLFGGGLGGTDTLDVGLSWRLFSRAALAIVAEDVTRPRLSVAGGDLPRRWVGELVLRPVATDRLELAAAALHVAGDGWSDLAYRFRLAVRAGGWRLLGDVDVAPRRAGALPAGTEGDTDWRVTAGVAVDFDHGSLVVAGRRAFTPAAVAGDRLGASALWQVTGARSPSPIEITTVVRVTLDDKLDSDREFLTLALRLQELAADRGVAAVLLRIEDLDLGMGRIEELRDLVAQARERGKAVIAYLTQASTKQLYLASACDRIVIHPAGEVTFAGLARSVTFYKGAMDRLGVSVDLVRVAEYKGAMEPYVMTGQSAPVRQNRDALLDDVYGRLLGAIASGRSAALLAAQHPRAPLPASPPPPGPGVGLGRGPESPPPSPPPSSLDVAALEKLLAVGSFTPAEARDAGLLDAIWDDADLEQLLRTWLDRPSISIRDLDQAPQRPWRWTRPRVAVVLIDGNITDGRSRNLPFDLGGVAGSDSLVDALEQIRGDSTVRAVVLRVNSPGGSAFASDVIARAVARVRAAGKPVITSMGDVAASGGYYVAAPSDVIFAQPSSTTGSIGIFGFKLDVSRLLAAVSINVEVTRRGPHADALSSYRPWTPEEKVDAERKIRHMYGLFTATVVEGRKGRGLSSHERVDAVGRGAVWTGAQARARGLVDEFGGLTAAIDRAAAMGRIPRVSDEPVELVVLPRPSRSLLGSLAGASELGQSPEGDTVKLTPALRDALRLAAPYVFGRGEGIEARLLYDYDLDVR